MKPRLYIHRNLYARGFGFSIVREGVIVFSFWLWNLSGHFYFGGLKFNEESIHNRRLKDAEARADLAEIQIAAILKQKEPPL